MLLCEDNYVQLFTKNEYNLCFVIKPWLYSYILTIITLLSTVFISTSWHSYQQCVNIC